MMFRKNFNTWAGAGMTPLIKKLGMKPGMRVLIVQAPDGYLESLGPLPEAVQVSSAIGGSHEYIQFFATRKAEILKSAPKLIKAAAKGAVVWITYPKKTSGVKSDLYREEVWDAMKETGWEPVSAVAIDDVWSGLRFRPREDIKARNK